jgi:hypothetical protein
MKVMKKKALMKATRKVMNKKTLMKAIRKVMRRKIIKAHEALERAHRVTGLMFEFAIWHRQILYIDNA